MTDLPHKVTPSPDHSEAKPRVGPTGWTPASRRRRVEERRLAAENAKEAQERLDSAAAQLAKESVTDRIAAVYALVLFADEDTAYRQACIDLLCAALRETPVSRPENDDREKDDEQWRVWLGDRAWRQVILTVIAAHLRPNAKVSWRGYDLDFSGAIFDGGDLSASAGDRGPNEAAALPDGQVSFVGVQFAGGRVSFDRAQFTGAKVSFDGAQFEDGEVTFAGAQFSGGEVSFDGAQFTGAKVNFAGATFRGGKVSLVGADIGDGEISFAGAEFADGKVSFCSRFTGGQVAFIGSRFTGGVVSFLDAEFAGGGVAFLDAEFAAGQVNFVNSVFAGSEVSFVGAEFAGTTVSFAGAKFEKGPISFVGTEFTRGAVRFGWAEFSGSDLRFSGANFDGANLSFAQAKFTGGEVDFTSANFSSGLVDISGAIVWSVPPSFDEWEKSSPATLRLPSSYQPDQQASLLRWPRPPWSMAVAP